MCACMCVACVHVCVACECMWHVYMHVWHVHMYVCGMCVCVCGSRGQRSHPEEWLLSNNSPVGQPTFFCGSADSGVAVPGEDCQI